jgi:CheY-like chemotaxis protein
MPKTILIVDDSSSLRTVVKIALARAGYDVLEAGDGKEGLAPAGQGRQGPPDRQRREHAQHGRHHLRHRGEEAPAPQASRR